ncbi:hypothetical protein KR038_011250 [Drosophila bunnanda]|nr:hypothetical protein KR038_011250 [Drosophila bunnanda]
MEKKRKLKKVKGKKMARGVKSRAPVDHVCDPQDETRTQMPPSPIPPNQAPQEEVQQSIQHTVALKPKFLPNLKGLMFPKMVYEQAKRLVITPLMTYSHDPVAAVKLRGARCPSFELPNDMFPSGAPIWKITFLPEELLPMGFDAGAVFGTGVLARKYYPTDLLSAEHKGQTPPLFIGHRNASYILPKGLHAQAKGNGRDKGQPQAPPKRIQPLTPAPPPSPAFRRSILKPSAAVTDDMNRCLLRHKISVIEVVIMPTFHKPPSCYPMAAPMQMQYNMYAPDLSKVIFAMQEINMISVAILSTVHQPNVPEVALATMGNEECPTFELPHIFPKETNRQGPRFLPLRFLPDFCDAGCVFTPGSLPDSVFHGAIRTHYDLEQHHYSMTPPLFVGHCKQKQESGNGTDQVYKIDSVAMQLKRLALRNMAATKKNNTNTSVPLPESTKRSNEFKLSAAAGKPKGFVLIESNCVPRGAIRTDFFGAFLMGCFFKITPNVKSESKCSSESEEADEEQDFQDSQAPPKTLPREHKASQAGEPAVQGTEAKTVEAEKPKAKTAEVEEPGDGKPKVEKPESEESEAELNSEDYETEEFLAEDCESEEKPKAKKVVVEEPGDGKPKAEELESEESEADLSSEDYETEEYLAEDCESEDCESEGYEAEEVDFAEYEAQCRIQGIHPDDIDTDEYEADEGKTEELDPDETESDEYEGEEGKIEETDLDEVETDEYEADEGKSEELDPDEIETDEFETDQDEADEGKTEELDPDEIETDEFEAADSKSEEQDPDEIETDEFEAPDGKTGEQDPDEIETDEFEAADSKSEELDPDEIETDEFEAPDGKTGEQDPDEIETDEFEAADSKTGEQDPDEIETDQFEADEGKAEELDQDEIETDEYEPEQTDGVKPNVAQGSRDAQPLAKGSNLKRKYTDTDNDITSSTEPVCRGCSRIYSYFTVDSNLDDIAEAAGDLATADFEVIVHPSELPGINVSRAVEQFRQVLQCRNEIRAKMTGMINAHVVKMEANHNVMLASPAPDVNAKRVFRKPCSQCGKKH